MMFRVMGGCAVGLVLLGAQAGVPTRNAAPPALGLFTASGDVGVPSSVGAGAATWDEASKTYTVTGGGENMWAAADHFHYVWKRVSGDVTLEAAITFTASQPAAGTPDPHRKAALIIRQSLDADAVYADAALHGDGLTSLQWRDAKGAVTHEVQSDVVGPARLRVEKRGAYVSMSIAGAGEPFRPAGGAAKIDLTGEYSIRKNFALFANLRNVNDPTDDVEIAGPNTPAIAQFRQRAEFGSLWTFGIKGTF